MSNRAQLILNGSERHTFRRITSFLAAGHPIQQVAPAQKHIRIIIHHSMFLFFTQMSVDNLNKVILARVRPPSAEVINVPPRESEVLNVSICAAKRLNR